IPDRLHIKNNPRVPDIIVVADPGYAITTTANLAERGLPKGVHGYDNITPEMQAIFYAHGPSFNRGQTIGAFQNIHVYELLCHLLDIRPAPNNGSLDSLRHTLAK